MLWLIVGDFRKVLYQLTKTNENEDSLTIIPNFKSTRISLLVHVMQRLPQILPPYFFEFPSTSFIIVRAKLQVRTGELSGQPGTRNSRAAIRSRPPPNYEVDCVHGAVAREVPVAAVYGLNGVIARRDARAVDELGNAAAVQGSNAHLCAIDVEGYGPRRHTAARGKRGDGCR